MMQRVAGRGRGVLAALAVTALLAFLAAWGCGTGGYDTPTTTATPTALIGPEVLKQWMDEGKVNADGYEKVVILEVEDNVAAYNSAHIPGALHATWSELNQTRLEGVSAIPWMVPDGAHMDALVQRLGIDEHTTVVFTTAAAEKYIWATRAYFAFRYWGFPKERLKVLDGYNKAWAAAYPGLLDNAVPAVRPSSYSVRNNGAIAASHRASLGEMIKAVSDNAASTVVVDMRTPAYSGTGATTYGQTGGYPGFSGYAVFEGRIAGARTLGITSLVNSSSNNRFLPTDNLVSLLGGLGITSGKTTYSYCAKGTQATAIYFVLDGILGWPAVVYDGSWSQWGLMSASATGKGGTLPSAAWATDRANLSSPINYNQDNTLAVRQLLVDPVAASLYTTVTDSGANQVENEDAEYMQGGSSGGSSSGGGSPSGGGC